MSSPGIEPMRKKRRLCQIAAAGSFIAAMCAAVRGTIDSPGDLAETIAELAVALSFCVYCLIKAIQADQELAIATSNAPGETTPPDSSPATVSDDPY